MLAVLAVAAVALTGCTTSTAVSDDRTAAITGETAPSTARDLVNTWVVDGRPGSTQLLISDDKYVLWDDCGVWTGSWAAYAGTALFGAEFGYDECTGLTESGEFSWLASVTSFDGDSGSMAFSDSSGATIATLTPSPTVADLSDYADQFIVSPVTDEDLDRTFVERAPLPQEAAVADDISGAWHLVGAESKTLVTFTENGELGGYDGCNWFGADKWLYDRRGNFITTGIVMTGRACADVDEFEVYQMTTAGIIDDELVLYDFEGNEIARAERVAS